MASDYYASLGKNLIGTKTFDNLMAAFAGESQARNKYTYFASKAKKDGYEQIAKLFLQTADNEKEHAKIWYKILEGVHSTADNLEIAADGEHEEWTEMYPTFAKEAREEGFQEIALPLPMYVLSATILRLTLRSTPRIIDNGLSHGLFSLPVMGNL